MTKTLDHLARSHKMSCIYIVASGQKTHVDMSMRYMRIRCFVIHSVKKQVGRLDILQCSNNALCNSM